MQVLERSASVMIQMRVPSVSRYADKDSESLLQTELVLADVVRVQITWVETDVFD
jgi:hypothetical protein